MIEVKFYYIVENGGDGSADVLFYGNKESAELAYRELEKSGENFTDNEPRYKTLKFSDKGILLNSSEIPDYA